MSLTHPIAAPTSTHSSIANRLEPCEVRRLSALCLLSFLLGLCYVFVVRPGMPYDEPSHWSVVKFYARFAGLPVMGQPGVAYEGYQSPGFYALGSIVVHLTQNGGERFSFYALRVLGAALMMPLVWLCYLIARHTLGKHQRTVAFWAALFVAFNPSVLAIFSGVQNDGLSMTLCSLALYLTLRWVSASPEEAPCPAVAATLGALVAGAMMTKLTSTYLLVVIPLFVLLMRRNARESVRFAFVFGGTLILLCGWWFGRNRMLYGDWTGSAAMQKFFPEGTGPTWDFRQPRGWVHLASNFVAYLWVPVEYYRNLIGTPLWIRGAIVFWSGLAVAGWLPEMKRRARQRLQPLLDNKSPIEPVRKGVWLLSIAYTVCVAIYLLTITTQWFIPARFTLTALIAPAIALVGGGAATLRHIFSQVSFSKSGEVSDMDGTGFFYGVLLALTLLLLNAYVLWNISHLAPQPFELYFV